MQTAAQRIRIMDVPAPQLRVGVGRSAAQHGEIFQGQIEDDSFHKRRCLLSLPCNRLVSRAEFCPAPGESLVVDPPHKEKARRVAELALNALEGESIGGNLSIDSNTPEGKGYGSSTADCVAAALAIADSLGRRFSEDVLARIVVEAEIASDNFMFSRAVLFAHREGKVLEDYGATVPALDVLGIDTDPGGIVDTLDYTPALYSWKQIQSFKMLTGALRHALRRGDIHLLARIATVCSEINQEFLPKPMFREIQRLVHCSGALGTVVAHSGTVLAILLDPNDPQLEHKVEKISTELHAQGITELLRFRT